MYSTSMICTPTSLPDRRQQSQNRERFRESKCDGVSLHRTGKLPAFKGNAA
jgi:hypothetical protein